MEAVGDELEPTLVSSVRWLDTLESGLLESDENEEEALNETDLDDGIDAAKELCKDESDVTLEVADFEVVDVVADEERAPFWAWSVVTVDNCVDTVSEPVDAVPADEDDLDDVLQSVL